MNKRIIELADQAGFYFDEYNPAEKRKVELLIELVIHECAHFQYIRAIYRDGYDKHEDAEAMRSFFGV
jgi:hypothetical protein